LGPAGPPPQSSWTRTAASGVRCQRSQTEENHPAQRKLVMLVLVYSNKIRYSNWWYNKNSSNTCRTSIISLLLLSRFSSNMHLQTPHRT
jgi:hypothetical protein